MAKKILDKGERLIDRTPFCVRFREGDLATIRRVGLKEHQRKSAKKPFHPTQWMRKVVLERARRVVAGEKFEPLHTRVTAAGAGESVCLRFKPSDYTIIRAAALQESDSLPSGWLRAVLMQKAGIEVPRGKR